MYATDPAIGIRHRANEHPVGPRLRNHGVRLHPIQNVLSLLGGLLGLFRGGGVHQGLIGCVELLLQLLVFLFQRDQLLAGIFIFPQGRDRLSDLFRIDLRFEIDLDDHNFIIECRVDLLIQDQHQSGCIGVDFVSGDVQPLDNRDAFQIRRHLFEGVSFGSFGCEADGIFSGVAITHAMFALGSDDTDFCLCRDRPAQMEEEA